jgi:integrase
LSKEEYYRLLSVSLLPLKRLIICGYETGMRSGEIQKLTWPKVDLKAGLIRLEGKDTKTGEGRPVPISLALREVLEEIRREQKEGEGSSDRWTGVYLEGLALRTPGMEESL